MWENHFLACAACNSNNKRVSFLVGKSSRKRLLIDPTTDDPRDDLVFVPRDGRYEPRTQRGRVSIRTFGLNREVLTKMRASAWATAQAYILCYGASWEDGRPGQARRYLDELRRFPFSLVLATLLEYAARPTMAAAVLDSDIPRIVRRHPELLTLV